MAKIGTIIYRGSSGKEYAFDVYPMKSDFDAIYAIYIVTKREEKSGGGGTHAHLYVGQTTDLSTRFDGHHKQDCFDEKGGNTICVHQVSTQNELDTIEEDLIKGLQPTCNDQLK